jgi:hypothetical protein
VGSGYKNEKRITTSAVSFGTSLPASAGYDAVMPV